METDALQSGLKTAAGCSVRVVGRVLGYTAIGLIINIIFIVLLTPEISGLFHSPVATVERGVAVPLEGIGYALAWVGKNTLPLVLYLVFAIGFTLAYFLIGKKQGVASALNYAFNSNKSFIVANTLTKFLEYLETKIDPSSLDSLPDLGARFDNYKKKMANQPVAVRWISKTLFEKFDLVSVVSEVAKETDRKDMTSKEYIVQLAVPVSDRIDVELFKPSLMPFLVLVTINVSLGIALKLFL